MSPFPPPNGSNVSIRDWPFYVPGRPASPTPGSRKAGAPAPAAPVAVQLRAAAVRPRHERRGP